MNRKTSKDGKWAYHDVPYLVEHLPTGTFYIRKRFGRVIVQRSLGTKLVSEAKARLADKLVELRCEVLGTPVERELPRLPAGYKPKDEILAQLPRSINLDPGKATKFSEAAAIYLDEIQAGVGLSEPTKRSRSLIVRYLLTLWSDVGSRRLTELTPAACREFFVALSKKYSPTYYNQFRHVFRAIVEIMRGRDARLGLPLHEDPMKAVRRLGVPLRQLVLPSGEQFERLFTYLDRQAPKTAFTARVGAYLGVRWSEAATLRWGDVDLGQRQVRVWCAKRRKVTSQTVYRYVPMIPDAFEFFSYWTEVLRPLPQDRVVGRRIDVTLDSACKALGFPHLRFHDLRHLFATRAIEAGVDIPTVSRWLGHTDGGVLALRVYGHLRNDHSQQQAARIKLQESHAYRSLLSSSPAR